MKPLDPLNFVLALIPQLLRAPAASGLSVLSAVFLAILLFLFPGGSSPKPKATNDSCRIVQGRLLEEIVLYRSNDSGSDNFDLYMRVGYMATKEQCYDEALKYFRLAQALNPRDSYAKKAIANVESYLRRGNKALF